jgi:hypothetical protein
MNSTPQVSDNAWKTWGVYIQPGIGMAYPELNTLLQNFFREKVAKIPWLPSGWFDAQAALQTEFPDDQVRIAPAALTSGAVNPQAPLWLDTAEKRERWQELFKESNSIVTKYAAGQAELGRAELESLYANAAFWDRMYNIAVSVRDFPKNVVSAVGDFSTDLIIETLKKFWIPIAVIGIGAFIYYNRGGLMKAAARKAGI